MEKQAISVIVPICDVADYLDDCLRSIVAQTYENLEIILVDDGSADGSGAMCDKWARRDARIVVFHQENRGLSAARNVGLDCATGEFVAFVDRDDTVDALYAETLHRALLDMGTPCVVCGYVSKRTDGPGRISHRPAITSTVASSRECLERALTPSKTTNGFFAAVWCKMYRRSLFEDLQIRFPENENYEDVSVLFPIVHGCGQVGLIPDVLYCHRIRPGSISQTNTAANIRDWERARNRLAQSVKEAYPDLGDEVDRYLEKGRIGAWLQWQKLWMESGGDDCPEAIRPVVGPANNDSNEIFFCRRLG